MPSWDDTDKRTKPVEDSFPEFWQRWKAKNWVQRVPWLLGLWVCLANPVAVELGLKQYARVELPDWWVWVWAGVVAVLFVVSLVLTYRATRTPKVSPPTLQTRAVKWLLSYSADDAELFRQLKRQPILEDCLRFLQADHLRLGVLSGESGCGKTSFLLAGLGPTLKERNWFCLYVKLTSEPPLESFRRAIRQAEWAPGSLREEVEAKRKFSTALTTFVQRLEGLSSSTDEKRKCAHDSPLVLAFDQFEQLFALDDETLNDFIGELRTWYEKRNDLSVKLLISIREDRVGKLTPLQHVIGYELAATNNLFINKFSRGEAAEALLAIAAADGIEADKSFVEKELIPNISNQKDGRVSPIDLQISAWVVSQQSDADLRKFTRSAYRQLGEVEGMLNRHLTHAIGARKTTERRDAVVEVLVSLSDFQTFQRAGEKPLTELQRDSKFSPPAVKEAVEWLSSQDVRLIVPVPGVEETFELIHDKLVRAIHRLAHRTLDDLAKANTLLNRRVNEWLGNDRHDRYLLTWREYRLIREYQPKLTWEPNQQVKEELLTASWDWFRRLITQVVVYGMVLLALPLAGWKVWQSSHRLVWQCGRDADKLIDRVTDPVALTKAAARLNAATDSPSARKARDRAIRLAERIGDGQARTDAMLGMFAVWAKTDLVLALEVIEKIDVPGNQFGELCAAAEGWTRTDPKAAHAIFRKARQAAEKIPALGQRAIALGMVANAWANTDPKEALETATKIPEPGHRARSLRDVAGAGAKVDPKAALEAAEKIPDPVERSWALSAAAEAWAKTDPKAALEVAEKIPDPSERARALSAVAEVWAMIDPKTAPKFAEKIPDSVERARALRAMMAEAWAKIDLKAAFEAAEKIPGPGERSRTFRMVAEAWARTDPEVANDAFRKAQQVTEKITDSVERARLLSDVAEAWSKIDLKAALGVFRQVQAIDTNPSFKNDLRVSLRALIEVWAKSDPGCTLEGIDHLVEPLDQIKALLLVAAEFGRRGALSEAGTTLQRADRILSEAHIPERSELLRDCGVLQAQMRFWHDAYETAQKITSDEDRLILLATIRYEWSRRDQPVSIEVEAPFAK